MSSNRAGHNHVIIRVTDNTGEGHNVGDQMSCITQAEDKGLYIFVALVIALAQV